MGIFDFFEDVPFKVKIDQFEDVPSPKELLNKLPDFEDVPLNPFKKGGKR